MEELELKCNLDFLHLSLWFHKKKVEHEAVLESLEPLQCLVKLEIRFFNGEPYVPIGWCN